MVGRVQKTDGSGDADTDSDSFYIDTSDVLSLMLQSQQSIREDSGNRAETPILYYCHVLYFKLVL